MDQDKASFIKTTFPEWISDLSGDTAPLWGKMNVQQMVEHVTGFFKVSTDQIHFPLVTPEEHLPKYKEFLLSDKQFRENTKAPVLPEEPLPVREADLNAAKTGLKKAIENFFTFYELHPDKKIPHPVFGPLNFEEWILLHYKHVTHHARQFGLLPR
jgi:oxepin-CoA hydrolase/3-oxo-5,6-dehydrosuberyl-CoA semialdehyde dehydrogenase